MNYVDHELGLKVLLATEEFFDMDASVKFKKRLVKDTMIVIMETNQYENTLYLYNISEKISNNQQLLSSWLAIE